MCHIKSNINKNVYTLGIVDRDQQIIPTYSRTKKVRRSFTSNSSSLSASSSPSSSTDSFSLAQSEAKNSMEHTCQRNCDYILNKIENKQSDLCDKEMSTLKMDQSSCFLTSSQCQFHYSNKNDSDKNESTSNNGQKHVHLENTPFLNTMTKSWSFYRHRTAKRMASPKTNDCLVVVCLLILTVHQVFAKPIDNNMASLQDSLRSPCREEKIPPQEDHNQANIKGILQVIKRQSAIAKSIARQDVEQYLKITEDASVDHFHYRWRNMEQAWLYPQGKISKEFGDPVPETVKEHFRVPASKFNVETQMKTLLIERLVKLLEECDERFQLLLIGFHNILDDHNSKRSTMDLEKYNPLFEVFSRAKSNTQMVLCEIRTALHKLGANINILNPQNTQSSKAPNSSFYDWVIFREYINQLEHINEIVNIILEKI